MRAAPGYIVYPSCTFSETLAPALRIALHESREGINRYCARVEDCGTEKVVAMFYDGEETEVRP